MLPDDQKTDTGQPADAPVAPTTDQPVAQTPPVEEMPASTPPATSSVPGADTPAPAEPPTSPVEPEEKMPSEMPPTAPTSEEGGTEGSGDTTPSAPTV